jgi:hypothetical protein
MYRRLASRLLLHNLRVNVLGSPDWFKTVRRTLITSAIITIAFFAATREVVQTALMKAFVSEPASPLAMFACAGQCETPHGATPKYRPRPWLLITTSTVSRIALRRTLSVPFCEAFSTPSSMYKAILLTIIA